MSRAPTRFWPFPPGLLLAVLALVSQLALGALVLPDEASAADLDAIAILCQTGAPDAPQPVTPHQRHAADTAICPLSATLALPGAILTPAPLLPPPAIGRTAQIALPPPARGPPARPLRISLARGPPVPA